MNSCAKILRYASTATNAVYYSLPFITLTLAADVAMQNWGWHVPVIPIIKAIVKSTSRVCLVNITWIFESWPVHHHDLMIRRTDSSERTRHNELCNVLEPLTACPKQMCHKCLLHGLSDKYSRNAGMIHFRVIKTSDKDLNICIAQFEIYTYANGIDLWIWICSILENASTRYYIEAMLAGVQFKSGCRYLQCYLQ